MNDLVDRSSLNLVIDRSSFLKSLNHVQSVVERRNTIPILSNVKIDASVDSLKLSATDMDIEVIEKTSANVMQNGEVTASAHTLYDIIRKLPDGAQVELVYDNNQLALASGRSSFKLPCLPADDFPSLTSGDFINTFKLESNDLRSLIDKTKFAISTEETRYYLNGIFLHSLEVEGVEVLRAVATDGHRLALSEMVLPDGASNMPGVIIPRKAVLEIRKLIDEISGEVEINLSESKIRFSVGDTFLTSKLIDGEFPEYERVIPKENDKILEVRAKSFSDAVDRVSAISAEKSRSIKLNFDKGLVVLSASSPDNGSSSEELEANYESDSFEIGFNSRYLLDILQQIEGEAVRFNMSGPDAPTIVNDATDGSSTYVLMPMRV